MSRRIHLQNARPFDSLRGTLGPPSTLVVEGGRIVEVTPEPRAAGDALVIDAGGRVATPGLIDCHVHVTAVTHDFFRLAMQPASYVTAQAKGVLAGMLQRGFTTVRDAAGADFGLQRAVAEGHFEGPQLFIAGQPISQTGGHADSRPPGVQEMPCACGALGLTGAIADGDAQVRRAVREQVRNGANQIKVMAGGGISSPTDPLEGTQYSLPELQAICQEASAADLYVLAHAYSSRAIRRAVEAGVRSIEHGNLLDDEAARAMAQAGAYLVPTLVTYAALADEGAKLGWSEAMLAKLERVRAHGVQSLQIAAAHGIPIAFGTDLLGHMHARQNEEFAIRASVQSPAAVVQSATSVAAKLLRQEGSLGVLAAGARADVLLVEGDPTQSVAMWMRPESGIRLLMQGGELRWNHLPADSTARQTRVLQ
jgi:imidazolonepropionase-like amidohydrolase